MAEKVYYKGLDGFRALAVIMVVMIHSRWLPIGWIGVQMFFVLSGFLITGILVAEKNASLRHYLGRFYWRRSMRIWPLYYLLIGCFTILYFLFNVPETFKAHWLALLTYTYNFARMAPHFADSDYFGHFWTLCIEEQFYLVWPFVVYFLPLPKFRWLVIGLIIGGPVIRLLTGMAFAHGIMDPKYIPNAVNNLTTSHLDAFASGAFLALLPVAVKKRHAPKSRQIFLVCAAVTFICGLVNSWVLKTRGLDPHWQAFGYDDLAYLNQYVWAYSLLNLTSAALIFCLIEGRFLNALFQHPFSFTWERSLTASTSGIFP